jgi:hypothetical protein
LSLPTMSRGPNWIEFSDHLIPLFDLVTSLVSDNH